jgi:hypothetical protein
LASLTLRQSQGRNTNENCKVQSDGVNPYGASREHDAVAFNLVCSCAANPALAAIGHVDARTLRCDNNDAPIFAGIRQIVFGRIFCRKRA